MRQGVSISMNVMQRFLVKFSKALSVCFRCIRGWVSTYFVRMFFHCNGIRFGRRCRAIGLPSVRVSLGGIATIGDDLYWRSGVANTDVGNVGSRLYVGPKGVLTIGHHVGMSNTTIVCHESVTIGNRVHVGGGVQIFDTDFHSLDPDIRNAVQEDLSAARTAPVVIRDGCFLGTNAMICKGVTIGENAVVGAGSVVVCDVGAGEIWAGNPARKIR